jgi:anti-sigma B factor antagonist
VAALTAIVEAGRSFGDTVKSYLSVDVRERPDATVLTVSGELDMASSPQLTELLDRLDPEHRVVVLDLSGLDFIDVTGLRVLLQSQERARRSGIELSVVNASRGVRRLLELTGTTGLLARG